MAYNTITIHCHNLNHLRNFKQKVIPKLNIIKTGIDKLERLCKQASSAKPYYLYLQLQRKDDIVEQFETYDSAVDLKDIDFAWDQLITDEDVLVEAGYPQDLLEKWIKDGVIQPFSPRGNKRHFYSKDVFVATVHHVLQT